MVNLWMKNNGRTGWEKLVKLLRIKLENELRTTNCDNNKES